MPRKNDKRMEERVARAATTAGRCGSQRAARRRSSVPTAPTGSPPAPTGSPPTISQNIDKEMTADVNYLFSGFLLALLTLEEERKDLLRLSELRSDVGLGGDQSFPRPVRLTVGIGTKARISCCDSAEKVVGRREDQPVVDMLHPSAAQTTRARSCPPYVAATWFSRPSTSVVGATFAFS